MGRSHSSPLRGGPLGSGKAQLAQLMETLERTASIQRDPEGCALSRPQIVKTHGIGLQNLFAMSAGLPLLYVGLDWPVLAGCQ